MKRVIYILMVLIFCSILAACNGQTTKNSPQNKPNIVGGGCEGCELMYVGMPEVIHPVSTSPGWEEEGQKLLFTGTVFEIDGKTPASGVIIYYWQTDNTGNYSPKAGMNEKAEKHGYIRGWVKTGTDGKYTIKTIRPAPYPTLAEPAHIHLSIKEPGIPNEYYTQNIIFDDDHLVIPYLKKSPQENRGGSGIVRILLKDNLQIGEHNIILGLNIPNYPLKEVSILNSGLSIGEDQPSFTPYHAYGPDKGTTTCPVCKYGRYHGIIYFAGKNPDWNDIKQWLSFLETESSKRSKYLKVYFVYGNDQDYNKKEREQFLEKIGKELNIQNLALTFVPSFSDTESEANLNRINPAAKNTFIVYRHRNIVDKFINIDPSSENFEIISQSLDRTKGEYFELPEIPYD